MLLLSRPPAALFALPEVHVPPDPEIACHVGQRAHVHDRRTQLRQLTLCHLGELTERHVGDDDAEDGVAQELQAFVVRLRVVLERV